MADSTTTVKSGGMGFIGWLTLVFVVLKFNPGGHLDSPVADWSWWLVLSPILICTTFILLVFTGLGLAALGIHLMEKRDAKRRRTAAWARMGRTPPK